MEVEEWRGGECETAPQHEIRQHGNDADGEDDYDDNMIMVLMRMKMYQIRISKQFIIGQ